MFLNKVIFLGVGQKYPYNTILYITWVIYRNQQLILLTTYIFLKHTYPIRIERVKKSNNVFNYSVLYNTIMSKLHVSQAATEVIVWALVETAKITNADFQIKPSSVGRLCYNNLSLPTFPSIWYCA